MKRLQELVYSLPPFLLTSIAGVLTATQIILAFVLGAHGSDTLQWAGWVCLWTAGVLGTRPIITFRKKGGVPRGQSYIKTTVLVDTGIYAIVRHPQVGTSWLLINLGVMLIAGRWTSVLLGLVSMGLAYADTFQADRDCIEKFGAAYERYMQRVPRVNLVTGIIRLVRRRTRQGR
jgi:protein-S-isoprenylcysteine O-methyltransferase Ste14